MIILKICDNISIICENNEENGVMKQKLPKHLSYDYQLNLDSVPTHSDDRLSLKLILPAIFLGLLMMLLAMFEMFNGMYDAGKSSEGKWHYVLDANTREPLFSHLSVDFALIILGIGIIISAIVMYIRYKKIYFNGRTFSEDFRGVFGEVEMFRENINNYRGVRFRVEFFQYGIVTKNKYIIELEHRDPQKTIPLYISTDGRGIYQIWNYYAKRLDKPALIDTDEGTVIKEVYDLDKSLKEYLTDNGMLSLYRENSKPTKYVSCSVRSDKTVIKPKRLLWDPLSIVGALWLAFFSIITAAAANFHQQLIPLLGGPLKTYALLASATVVLLSLWLILLQQDKIVIKAGKLILVHKFLLLARKEDETSLGGIKDIAVTYNPSTDRYYLAIIGKDRVLTFGKKMPIEDLQWVRDFIISEIVR